MLSRDNLHEYQRKAVNFIIDKKRCQLWLDMGLGKSVTTLTAITDLLDSFSVNRVLVIAPLRVANSVWKQEARNWAHLNHLAVSVCTGSEKARMQALQAQADVYVINRENVSWLCDLYQKRWPFDCVIIDEASSFKSASSQRFKSLKRILPHTSHLVMLTGTPSPNGLLDLWAQAYLVDFGAALGKTMTGYKQRFFESDYMGYKFSPREGANEKIQALLADYTLSMKAEDYLDMPDYVPSVLSVQLDKKALAAYDDFENQLFLEIGDHDIEAQSAAVLANKLLQFANGAMYVDEHKNWVEIHNAKIEALADLVEDNPNENLLIAYNYKSDLERLTAKFPDAVVLDKNPETIDRWNAGQIKMLLAHPASAGHGLNLQKGGSVIVWFGLNWSLELYQQFNGRLYRQGQAKPVRIIHICSESTIDARVISVLTDKAKTQHDLMLALKH
jgi:SNF2 family DNA or RNA helicase